jgi:site-specific DNA-methyltransferase (adenine-specific)
MPYIKYTWEYIEVFDKKTHKKTGRREDIDITADEFKEWVIGRWTFPPEIRMKDYDHPAMFPEELPRRLMKLFSYRNDIILDPFNGAGTTTLVARKLGRRFIGIDISEQYCIMAFRRVIERCGVQKATSGYPEPVLVRICNPSKESVG